MRHAILLLLLALPVRGADIHVQPGQSIQAAINQAVNGDRVLVAPGTYYEAISFRGKAIFVLGVGGPEVTTIDATGLDSPVVSFHLGEGPDSRLQGFTITGGSSVGAHWGGGISCRSIEFALTGSPTVTDCIVRGNFSFPYPGGGVSGGSPTLERCVVVGNSCAPANGGGVAGTPTLRHCIVANNVAFDGYGGGVAFLFEGGGRLEDCVIQGNVSDQSAKGGGVYVGSGAQAEILRCVILENVSDGWILINGMGAGVFVDDAGAASIRSCTIVDNVSTEPFFPISGGLHGPAVVTSSILRGNRPNQVVGLGVSVSYSDVEGGFAGTGNIDLDPLFADPLQGDYHLASGSPCIDTGDPGGSDPDGSVEDMGAHWNRTLYTRSNTGVVTWQDASWPVVSLAVGGRAALVVRAGAAHAGKPYVTLGSLSGTSPGIPVLGQVLPLNLGPYLFHTALHPNAPPLAGSFGTLDGGGSATTVFSLPAGFQPALAGLTVWHATLVLETSPVLGSPLVTNAEAAVLVP